MVSERVKVHVGLTAAVIVFIVSVALLLAGTLDRGDLHAALPGSVAPDFSLRDAENQPVALSELRGNVVIVYFRGRDLPGRDLPGREDAASDVATTQPSDAAALAASTIPASNPGQPQLTDGPMTTSASASADDSSAAIAELSAMCREAHNSHLKVLELDSPASVGDADSIAQPAVQAAVQGPTQSQHSDGSPVRTLFDLSGEVARKYKIDSGESKPTFFVIDPSGIIRYRSNSLRGDGASAADSLLAPATQPSSCPQVIQTLLSTEAVDLSLRAPSHF